MPVRLVVIAALACTVVAAEVSAGAEREGAPLYAVTENGTGGRLLTQRDPATLSAVGPSAKLSGSSQAAAFSPDGSQLAFVQWAGDRPSLRILELARMQWRRQVPLNLTTGTVLVRWLDARRLLALAEQREGLRVLVRDTRMNRWNHANRIRGHLTDRYQVAVAQTRAAVLIRAGQGIGAVRVAVASSSGSTRIVTVNRIREGSSGRDIYRPSLVASPLADQAYVVGSIGEPVATINLRTLAISYRKPFASAGTAAFAGAERMTVWLGGGRFAAAGWDDGAPGYDSKLLGLRVVDTRSWRTRVLDPDSDYFCVAGHSVVGHHLDGTLIVFGFDGTRRIALTLPDGGSAMPSTSNDRYLYLGTGGETLIADLASGRVIGRRAINGVQELLSPTYTLGAGCR